MVAFHDTSRHARVQNLWNFDRNHCPGFDVESHHCEWTGDTRSVHGGRSCRESFVTQWALGGRRALEDTAMFTSQNTEGYAQEELDELNDLLAELLAALTDAERQDKSIVDRVSGKILAHYDMRTVE